MKARWLFASMAAALSLPGWAAQSEAADISMAIYEGGFSVVEEARRVTVAKGDSTLALDGLPDGVQPDTLVANFAAGSGVRLRGQRFLNSKHALLDDFVGKTILVVTTVAETGQEIVREAKLLRARPGLLIELDGRIELSPPGRIALPGLDDGVVLRSTYALDIDADRAGPVDYRLSYMAQGLGWTADYAVELDKAEQTASIQGRATVRAPAGRSYRNARVRLVAGSVNRHVHRGPRPQAKMAMRASAMAADAESIGSPVSVSELQVYELPRRQDLRAGAEEKVVLFNAARVPVQKTYRLISDSNAHIRHWRGPAAKRNPDVRLKFKNEAANGLGMPLPKGVMRAYGQGLFLGEDRIRHTPKGEDVSIAIGRAVDVTAERRRTDYRIQGLPKGTAEVAYQITLRNAKSQDVTVDIVERMIGEWQILSQSLPHKKDTDRQAVWQVPVPAGGEVSLRYKARVRFC